SRRVVQGDTGCTWVESISSTAAIMQTGLITGGTGFIGSHLIPRLLADGWHVEVLTRDTARARRGLPEAAVALASLDQASEPGAIINLAGENLSGKRWSAAQKRELMESRQRTTRDLIAFI